MHNVAAIFDIKVSHRVVSFETIKTDVFTLKKLHLAQRKKQKQMQTWGFVLAYDLWNILLSHNHHPIP